MSNSLPCKKRLCPISPNNCFRQCLRPSWVAVQTFKTTPSRNKDLWWKRSAAFSKTRRRSVIGIAALAATPARCRTFRAARTAALGIISFLTISFLTGFSKNAKAAARKDSSDPAGPKKTETILDVWACADVIRGYFGTAMTLASEFSTRRAFRRVE